MKLRIVASFIAGAVPAAVATWYVGFADATPEPRAASAVPDAIALPGGAPDAALPGSADTDTAPADGLAAYRNAAAIDDVAELESRLGRLLAEPFAPARDIEIGALFQRLAALDLERALVLAETPGFDSRLVADVVRALAEMDADAGLAALAEMDNTRHRRAVALELAEVLGTDGESLDRIAALLPVPLRIDFQAEALARLAATDPNAALGTALSLADDAARNAAAQRVGIAWLEEDPLAAMARADSLPEELATGYRTSVSLAWARQDLTAFLGYANAQPRLDNFLAAMTHVMGVDPLAAFTVAAEHPPVPIGGGFGPNFTIEREAFAALSGANPDQALRMLELMPNDPRRQELLTAFAEAYARKDPGAAMAWARSVAPPNLAVVSAVIARGTLTDLDLALRWLSDPDMPAELARAQQTAANDIGIFWGSDSRRVDIANTLKDRPDPNSTAALLRMTRVWMLVHPESALDWMLSNNMAFDPAMAANLSRALAQRNAPAAAALVDRMPPAVREAWIREVAAPYAAQNPAAAMNWLTQFSGEPGYADLVGRVVIQTASVDPQGAAQYLVLASPAVQEEAAARVGIAWAMQDLTGAARWATGLSNERARTLAVGRVATTWTNRDPVTAQRWAVGLPRGPVRDEALAGVLRTLGGSNYVSTLDTDLFAAFDSSAMRDGSVTGLVTSLASSDPAEARRIVDRWVDDPRLRQQMTDMLDRTIGQ